MIAGNSTAGGGENLLRDFICLCGHLVGGYSRVAAMAKKNKDWIEQTIKTPSNQAGRFSRASAV
jgi:hypothetical protein